MKQTTKNIHETVAQLGADIGFRSTREVSASVLSLRLDAAYTPRADLMWSLPMSESMAKAIAEVWGVEASKMLHLPVVGIEIEGTDPTTKTLEADTANIAAIGTRLGLLIVSEMGSPGMYRRAVRLVRTVRRAFGDISIVPMEASWMDRLSKTVWDKRVATIPSVRQSAPSGGESLEWSRRVRQKLRAIGTHAGFVVVEPYVPPILQTVFAEQLKVRGNSLLQTIDPIRGKTKMMTHSKDLLTQCKIDMAWLLPLPRAMRQFLEKIAQLDPCLRADGILYPELYNHLAVVGFELESGTGKHAGGGLLNLAAYCVLGVAVTPSPTSRENLDATLNRYRPTLGLRNVKVRCF